ncbi:CaiB/BaiF CoA-transferase family protein [Limnohabitans sp. Jir72]|uniref:CaiB/BaiF CoA transferase family protein n=1 Tax=Limnohabitans sp. Jir72 TaxID=1977909 RepID=UPI000D35B8DC|nr:CoA transferase [Limnohabitans sp. Jir72]PUE35128.1 CoA transferase [Limnohabitans sp. Jir72]
MAGALNGLRILDLTSVLMGPFATQLMADMGADVIKIESPAGDTVRGIGPMRHAGMGAIFLHVNRNKRSLVLDLKKPEGLNAFFELVKTADVVVYNIRPQAMQRLGIDYERLQAINPRIIYAGLYGYSEKGPYAGKPAYDDLIQGAAAVPSLVSLASGGEPRYVPLTLADRTVGLMASNTILAAVIARYQTGVGQAVEVPMFETMAQYVLGEHMAGATFEPALGPTGYPRLLVQERRPYPTLDGHVCVLIYTDRQWETFLGLIGRAELFRQDPRLASIGARTLHINDLYRMVAEAMATQTTEVWMARLNDADIPCMPMHDVDSLLQDPHLLAVGMLQQVEHPTEGRVSEIGVPVSFSGTPTLPVQKPAPQLGQHSVQILREAGLSDAAIEELQRLGVTSR